MHIKHSKRRIFSECEPNRETSYEQCNARAFSENRTYRLYSAALCQFSYVDRACLRVEGLRVAFSQLVQVNGVVSVLSTCILFHWFLLMLCSVNANATYSCCYTDITRVQNPLLADFKVVIRWKWQTEF